jgi:hypothetical protein
MASVCSLAGSDTNGGVHTLLPYEGAQERPLAYVSGSQTLRRRLTITNLLRYFMTCFDALYKIVSHLSRYLSQSHSLSRGKQHFLGSEIATDSSASSHTGAALSAVMRVRGRGSYPVLVAAQQGIRCARREGELGRLEAAPVLLVGGAVRVACATCVVVSAKRMAARSLASRRDVRRGKKDSYCDTGQSHGANEIYPASPVSKLNIRFDFPNVRISSQLVG